MSLPLAGAGITLDQRTLILRRFPRHGGNPLVRRLESRRLCQVGRALVGRLDKSILMPISLDSSVVWSFRDASDCSRNNIGLKADLDAKGYFLKRFEIADSAASQLSRSTVLMCLSWLEPTDLLSCRPWWKTWGTVQQVVGMEGLEPSRCFRTSGF